MDYTKTSSTLTQHTFEHDGCPLHYWLSGQSDRPTVVMMHGATMDHRMFNAQVEALQSDYHVLVWDARGHGKSQPTGKAITLDVFADDMLAILDHEGIDSCILMGQSLGGYIAQTIYQHAPDRVMAMIIIGATPIAKPYSFIEVFALKATLPLFNWMPYGYFSKLTANNTAITPDVQAYALKAVQQIPQDEFLTIWKSVTLAIDTQGKPDFHIDVPLLLVHGDKDKAGTIKRDMPWWQTHDTHAEFHIIPSTGHNANQDNPPVTNQLILDFLSRLPD